MLDQVLHQRKIGGLCAHDHAARARLRDDRDARFLAWPCLLLLLLLWLRLLSLLRLGRGLNPEKLVDCSRHHNRIGLLQGDQPEFRVVAIDYGVALAVLLAGAIYGLLRWDEPGATWLISGVAVSLVAGLVQGLRLAPHRWFNHNDLFHVIQTVALYLFFRGGALLVDR